MQKASRAARFAFWASATLVIALFIVVPGLRPLLKRDRVDAPPRWGFATVVIYVPPTQDANGVPVPPQASVRFLGRILGVKEVLGVGEIRVGQTVRIHYRVGRSGRIYVDTAQPLPVLPASGAKPPATP